MKNKKKIVFLHRSLNQSGAVRQLINIYQGIDRTRFTPEFVLLRDDRLFYREFLDRPDVHVLRTRNESFLICLIRFIRYLKSKSPDIVQSFDPTGNLMLYLAACVYNTPLYFGSVRNTNQKAKYDLMEYIFQNRITRLVVNSRKTREELIRKAAIRHEKITIIPNGIDTDYFTTMDCQNRQALRTKYGIPNDLFVLSSPGRIHKQKNHLVILQALAVIKSVFDINRIKLFIIGRRQDLQLYSQIQDFISQHTLEPHVEFVEPTHAIRDYYHISDLVILASLWEGLPNVVLEAMACGRLVLASDLSDNDDIIQDGINGFKFSAISPEKLADAILRIVGMTENEKQMIAQKAREDVLKRFSLAAMIRRFQDLYVTSLDKRRNG